MKFFLGLEIPQAQREALTKIMDSSRWGFEFVRPERLHLTIRFLGVRPSHVELQRRKLQAATFTGKSNLYFDGVSRLRVHPVLQADISDPEEEHVRGIHAQVSCVLGMSPENYYPHVTLAKGKQLVDQADAVQDFLTEHCMFSAGSWLMDRLTLFASPGGEADYQVVETYPIL